MSKKYSRIISTGSYLPEKILTNHDHKYKNMNIILQKIILINKIYYLKYNNSKNSPNNNNNNNNNNNQLIIIIMNKRECSMS